MERNIRITLGNISFTIDEPAFDVLRRYLDDLERHFSGQEEGKEIVNDIEHRMAELFTAKLHPGKDVINLTDVQQVIAQLGNPGDMDESADSEPFSGYFRRRIYRDGERQVVGGVCSGLGAYFGIDPVWIRLLFIVMIFGIGTGVLLYIILWAIIPEAKTTAEKLEMHGRPVDLRNIEETMKSQFDRMGNFYRKEGKHRVRDASKRAGQMAEGLAKGAFGLISKAVAGVLLLLAVILLMALAVGVLMRSDDGMIVFVENLFSDPGNGRWAWISIVILATVPLITLIIFSFSVLFDLPRKVKPLRYALGGISTLAFLSIIYLGLILAQSLSEETQVKKEVSLARFDTDTLHLSFNIHPELNHGTQYRKWDRLKEAARAAGHKLYGHVHLNVSKSPDSLPHLYLWTYSRGADLKDARAHALRIKADWLQKDSLLMLNNAFHLTQEEPWRNQELTYELSIPSGYTLITDQLPENIEWLGNEDGDEEGPCRVWVMAENGLVCMDPSRR